MYIVSVTGASGSIIGIRLIEMLLKAGKEVGVIVTEAGWATMEYEVVRHPLKNRTMFHLFEELDIEFQSGKLMEYNVNDYFTAPASGTSEFEAVIVAPCSMKTLAAISCGFADNLVTRAVDVALKESRRVVLVPRETPVSLIHLENMIKAKRAGADILLPEPGFYTFPETIDDVVNFIAGKTLNLLGIPQTEIRPWGSEKK